MGGWLNSNSVRVASYLVAAAASVWAAWREGRQRRQHPYLWPAFWLMSAGLFLALALARAANLANLATELGRSEALAQGWYGNRRKYQTMAIGGVVAVWVVVVAVALWRIPARRRRYLPAALATFTLMCFIGARLISLHQVDAVLYRREIAGAQIGNAAEMTLLFLVVVLTLLPPRARYMRDPPVAVPVVEAGRTHQ